MIGGLRWGFATGANGAPVIRNFYLAWSATVGIGVVALMLVNTLRDTNENASVLVAVESLAILLLVGMVYLELRGVEEGASRIWYPVRAGFQQPFFPLFRGSVLIRDIAQASSLRRPGGLYVAYLSGRFGQARILFDTKGGRDRFFAVLKAAHPEITIYRWS